MIAFSMFLIVTGRIGDAEHAGAFARRRAGAAGELREIVRLVQAIERILPAAVVDEVVPLGNQVVDRATGSRSGRTARRNPCTARLACAGATSAGAVKISKKVLHPLERIAIRHRLPFEFFKTGWFTHAISSSPKGRPKIAQRFIAGTPI